MTNEPRPIPFVTPGVTIRQDPFRAHGGLNYDPPHRDLAKAMDAVDAALNALYCSFGDWSDESLAAADIGSPQHCAYLARLAKRALNAAREQV